MKFFKLLFTSFNPLGFLSGLSIKTWLVIAGAALLIGTGFVVRWFWIDYQSTLIDNAVKVEQNNQLEEINTSNAEDSRKGKKSEEINDITSDNNFKDQQKSDKDLKDNIKDKNDKLKNVPLNKKNQTKSIDSNEQPGITERDNNTDILKNKEIERSRSIIRLDMIHKAYCSTEPNACDLESNRG